MLHVVLYQPEIPPNTGNVIRLCANTGARLDLVGPLGFSLDDARLRRAGLDYHEMANVRCHECWADWLAMNPRRPVWAFSTKGARSLATASFETDAALLFGPESRGLPNDLLESVGRERVLRLPMRADSRSLNLSNAVAVAVYEAMRQHGYPGLA